MQPTSRTFAIVGTLILLAHAAVGCTTNIDGSAAFYDQHPEYRNQPSYMHPADPDDNSDEHPARPW